MRRCAGTNRGQPSLSIHCVRRALDRSRDQLSALVAPRSAPRYAKELRQGRKGDLEDLRLGAALEKEGVILVDPAKPEDPALDQSDVILNRWVSPQLRERWQKRQGMLLTAPGAEGFLDNKLLLAYLDSLITFYLRETPHIAVPRAAVVEVTSINLWTVGRNRSLVSLESLGSGGIVVKSARGGCGAEVRIFPPGARMALREVIDSIPDFWNEPRAGTHGRFMLVQRFVDIMELDGCKVDMRPLTYCLGGGLSVVAPLPIGRAQRVAAHNRIRALSEAKANVAQGASIMPLFEAEEELQSARRW